MALSEFKEKASGAYTHIRTNAGDLLNAADPYLTRSKSIVGAAQGNIFEFPVFISSSVSLDYATATSSLLEQVYASYLQAAISINPIVNDNVVRSGKQFSAFKSDTNKYLECVDLSSMPYADIMNQQTYITEGSCYTFDVLSIEDKDAKLIIEAVDKQPLSEFDHFFNEAFDPKSYYNNPAFMSNKKLQKMLKDAQKRIDELEAENKDIEETRKQLEAQKLTNKTEMRKIAADKIKDETDLAYKEKDINDKIRKQNEINEMNRENNMKILEDIRREQDELEQANQEVIERYRALEESLAQDRHDFEHDKSRVEAEEQRKVEEAERAVKEHKKKLREYKDKHKAALDNLGIVIDDNGNITTRADRSELREINSHNWKNAVAAPEMLDETKIKKLNTMKPIMMSVQLNVLSQSGEVSRPINYVIGVKTHNRIIDADILPEMAQYPIKEMDKISRKAKWRAGELKFFRDIVFSIKQKKQTAIDSKDPRRKWYRRLYELAHMRGDTPSQTIIQGKKLSLTTLRSQITEEFSHGVIPNCTLVISSEDVINIKAKTKIDLLNGSTASTLCEELYLIGIVVIDTNAESIKMLLPDLHKDYEVHSIASVNKQIAELDTAGTKTRDMFKLLA